MTNRMRGALNTLATVIAAAVYAAGIVLGMPEVARAAAVAVAASATIDLLHAAGVAAPRGTAMVSLAAYALPMEGFARMQVAGMDEAAFLEMAIGVYLQVALYQLTRGRDRPERRREEERTA